MALRRIKGSALHRDEIEASFAEQERGEKESERKRAELLERHAKR